MCVCVCVCIYIYIYTHTYTHTEYNKVQACLALLQIFAHLGAFSRRAQSAFIKSEPSYLCVCILRQILTWQTAIKLYLMGVGWGVISRNLLIFSFHVHVLEQGNEEISVNMCILNLYFCFFHFCCCCLNCSSL